MNKFATVWIMAAAVAAGAFTHEARADVVIIVSAKNTAQALTPEEISQIYLGKSTALKPVDNDDKSLVRNQFYSKIAGRDQAQVKAIWSKLVFTGKAKAPKELPSNADVVKTVAGDPTAIGYVDKSAVDSTVKVVLEVK